jgi:tricorn protease
MVSLRDGERSPFLPDDETLAGSDEKDGGGGKDDGEAGEDGGQVRIEIDLDGLQKRLMEVPVAPGNYSSLSVTSKHLYWIEATTAVRPELHLKAVEIENEDIEVKTVLEDIKRYELSGNLEKVLVHKGDNFYVFDASGSAPADLGKSAADLSGWAFSVDPVAHGARLLL